jgi:hypothetical protein
MKRIFVLLRILFIFFGLLAASCNIFILTPEENSAGDMMAYLAYYNLRVVNNAGVAITLYGPGLFWKSDPYTTLTIAEYQTLCRVETAGEAAAKFLWAPKGSLYYGDDFSVPDPPAEELKAAFHPITNSFYFKLVFGEDEGEEVYLVGWPQTIELVKDPKEEWDTLTIPREKIALYGCGYAENREVRIRDDFAYVPFTIKGAAPTEYDFDDADAVYANATLTINAINDINFETHSVSTEETF